MAKWTVIKIKKIPDVDKFRDEVGKNLKSSLITPQKDFQDFVGTWKHKPTIRLDTLKKLNEISAFTGVISKYSSGQKATPEDQFFFVARGTKVRYMKMSHDFIAKTKKGVISSGPGRGRAIGKSVTPLPGIEARDIEKTVKTKRKNEVIRIMKQVVYKAVRDSGGTKI